GGLAGALDLALRDALGDADDRALRDAAREADGTVVGARERRADLERVGAGREAGLVAEQVGTLVAALQGVDVDPLLGGARAGVLPPHVPRRAVLDLVHHVAGRLGDAQRLREGQVTVGRPDAERV